MNKKTHKWQHRIETIVELYGDLLHETEKWIEIGAMDVESRLHAAIFRSFDRMLELIDHEGLIAWYIFENDCGARGLSASPSGDGEIRAIHTPRDLAELIVESKK
jgi:hypothetical protein